MKRLLVIGFLALLSSSAFAQNTNFKTRLSQPEGSGVPPVKGGIGGGAAGNETTVYDCLTILAGLNEIDGKHEVVVNGGKPNETVREMVYEFGNGALRQDIAHDISILTNIQKNYQDAQRKILLEVSKGSGEIRQPDDKALPEEKKEYSRQMLDYNARLQELTSASCNIAGLKRIKIVDLKLDKNEIRGGALAAIDKILDK